MHVIGTAGHVDHGKSSLIEALTGVHPDRLKEEQQREMTIELGFGWLSLENGQEVGIVDVSGHIDFIGNLLSGIGGIDAVLFVIAADEGIMPQTLEHAAIIRLLQIQYGLIVITKVDLVPESETITSLKAAIRELFAGSILQDAPIMQVSSKTGTGIDDLKSEIQHLVQKIPPNLDYGRPRLPVDRVFQLQGIGTVVTGTLQDGYFSSGDSIVVHSQLQKGRIRELQIHGKKVTSAGPGNRVAINISGVAKTDIQRGDVITLPGDYEATRRMDASITTLSSLSKPLAHNTHVQMFIGAKSVRARVRVLGSQEIHPGEEGLLQLELTDAVIAMRNDRFILRRFSPGETIGGGIVLNAHATERYKRFEVAVINHLQTLKQNDPELVFRSVVAERGFISLSELNKLLNLDMGSVREIARQLKNQNELFLLNCESNDSNKGLAVDLLWMEKTRKKILGVVHAFHQNHPLMSGISLLEMRNQIKIHEMLLEGVIAELLAIGDLVEVTHQIYAEKGHQIRLSKPQEQAFARIVSQLRMDQHKPPSKKELDAQVGQKTTNDFIMAGLLVQVNDDLVYLPEQISSYKEWLQQHFDQNETLELAEFRDAFQTSRKYAQALLEYFDRIHFTERIADHRVLFK